MSRKTAILSASKSRPARKTKKRKNTNLAGTPTRGRENRGTGPAAIVPPPPGQGKRGERGYLAYLLRQAHAATRLTMERTLSEVGVTPPQFVVAAIELVLKVSAG